MDDQALIRRAFAAHFRTAGQHADIPSKLSDVEKHGGKWYVVLRGGRGRGPLAVYRVKVDGMLKRLRRWPAAIDE